MQIRICPTPTRGLRIALVLLAASVSLMAQAPRPLFLETTTRKPSQADPYVKRESFVHIDWRAMSPGRINTLSDVPALLNLNLFPDVTVLAQRTQVTWEGPDRFNWVGRSGDGDVILAIRNGHMAGTLSSDGRTYVIEGAVGGGHRITEVNTQKFDEDELAAPSDYIDDGHGANTLPQGPAPLPGAETVIDVLFIYEKAAADKTPGLDAHVAAMVEMSNLSYKRSLVPQTIRIVHSALVNSGISGRANLSWAQKDPGVAALRDQYGADLVTYFIDQHDACGTAGGQMNIVLRTCGLSNKSFPHELGHNMGAGHDAAQGGGGGFAHGWIDPGKKWRTVMAYPCSGGNCPRINNFSNPTVMENGVPTGDATSADNARAMRDRMVAVSNIRPTKVPVGIGSRTFIDQAASYSVRGLVNGKLDLQVTRAEKLEVSMLSLDGKKITLARRHFQPGDHRLAWDPHALPPGVQVLYIRGQGTQKVLMHTAVN